MCLVTSIYKLITKVLSCRLSEVLKENIIENQNDFCPRKPDFGCSSCGMKWWRHEKRREKKAWFLNDTLEKSMTR